jgi:hypothetical protein
MYLLKEGWTIVIECCLYIILQNLLPQNGLNSVELSFKLLTWFGWIGFKQITSKRNFCVQTRFFSMRRLVTREQYTVSGGFCFTQEASAWRVYAETEWEHFFRMSKVFHGQKINHVCPYSARARNWGRFLHKPRPQGIAPAYVNHRYIWRSQHMLQSLPNEIKCFSSFRSFMFFF